MKKRSLFILSSLFVLFLILTSGPLPAQTQPFEQSQLFQQPQMSTAVEESQPGDPYCDPLCNCRKDGSICPIDDGIYVLLAAGAIFGILHTRRSRTFLK
jgi:hypothetical protein